MKYELKMKECIEKLSFYAQTISFNSPPQEKEMADKALFFFKESINTRINLFKEYLYEYKDDGDEVDGAFLIYEAMDGACRVLEADKKIIKDRKKREIFSKYMDALLCLVFYERNFYKSLYDEG